MKIEGNNYIKDENGNIILNEVETKALCDKIGKENVIKILTEGVYCYDGRPADMATVINFSTNFQKYIYFDFVVSGPNIGMNKGVNTKLAVTLGLIIILF